MASKSVSSMKYKLYNKVYKQSTFSWFSAMINAGSESVVSNIIPPQLLAPEYNLAYGVLWGQIIGALVDAVNASLVQTSTVVLSQSAFNTVLQTYDTLVDECQGKLEIAQFDITAFDASGYSPGYAILALNSFCSYVKTTLLTQLKQLLTPVSAPPLLTQSLLNQQLQQQAQAQKQQKLAQVQPLIGTIKDYLNYVNSVIDSGFALDIAWWDRSVFATRQNNLNYLANGVKVQNASQAFGFVLDYSVWDFSVFLPDNFPLVQVFLVSLFGNLFGQHVYDPSKGGTNIQYSIPAEFYMQNMNLIMAVFDMVKQHFDNIWKANMVANAIIQLAWYNYKASYTYNSGAKYVYSYDQFVQWWTEKWLGYGLTAEDLAYARKVAENLTGGLKLLAERKTSIKGIYVQSYKPLFSRNNIISGGATWGQ